MQSIKRPKNKKRLILIISGLLVLGGGAAYVLIAKPFNHSELIATIPDRPTNQVDYGPPTEAEKQADRQQKEQIIKQQEDTPTATNDIIVSLVRADQAGPGAPLNIRADISGTASGSCETSLSKSGQPTVTKSFPVVFEATLSRCQGADIAAAAFSQGGEWKLSLVVKNHGKQSKPAQRVVDIKK